jgi:hypothetical protein
MGVRRGPSQLLAIFVGMVLIASAVEVMTIVDPGDRWSAWGCGVFLAALFSGLLHWRLQRQAGRLEVAIRTLPDTTAAATTAFLDEFEDLFYVLRGTSHRLQQEFATARESRLQLEALLDSMQDVVVSADAAVAAELRAGNGGEQPGASGTCAGADNSRSRGAGVRALGSGEPVGGGAALDDAGGGKDL